MGKINVNSILYDSVVDGPGLRAVIFLQGCEHKCIGCHNKDSWTTKENKLYNVENLVEEITNNSSFKKITISGGDPFLQKNELLTLCKLLKEKKFHICIYTGYLYEKLINDKTSKEVINNIDILIDGKFEENNKDISNSYIGSYNQKIYYLKDGEIIEKC